MRLMTEQTRGSADRMIGTGIDVLAIVRSKARHERNASQLYGELPGVTLWVERGDMGFIVDAQGARNEQFVVWFEKDPTMPPVVSGYAKSDLAILLEVIPLPVGATATLTTETDHG